LSTVEALASFSHYTCGAISNHASRVVDPLSDFVVIPANFKMGQPECFAKWSKSGYITTYIYVYSYIKHGDKYTTLCALFYL